MERIKRQKSGHAPMKHHYQQQGWSECSIRKKCLFVLVAFNPTNPIIRVIVVQTRVKDNLGSTRAVWAPDVGSGQLIEATGYLPYGTQVAIITPTANEAAREKFTGKELDKDGVGTDEADAETNTVTGVQLSYFGKRYYDAMTGVWTSTDPDHQFKDAYTYGPNNPLNGADIKGSIWQTTNISINLFYNPLQFACNYTASFANGESGLGPEYSKPPNPKGEAGFSIGTALCPLSDPQTFAGAVSRTVIQTWVHDPNDPDADKAHPMGERRVIQQVMTTYHDNLEGDERTDFLPAIPEDENKETYQENIPGGDVQYLRKPPANGVLTT